VNVGRKVRVWPELGASGAVRGADRGDVVVIIDALRASVTIVAGLKAGAARVLPVLTVEEAELYLGDPGYRLAGERGGAKLPQFHFGNSPTEIMAHRAEVKGRVLVVTTSNGTRCVNAALDGATAVLVGSTVNASAIARAAWKLALERGADVTLLAAGLRDQPSSEDTYAQGLLARRLVDLGAVLAAPIPDVHEADSLPIFVESEAAGRLTVLGYTEDVRLCARIDLWDTVPIYCQDGFYVLAC
jgi:phosphosulfolactate phosphohydrolase-like enzyme